jgi:hypothetical protein
MKETCSVQKEKVNSAKRVQYEIMDICMIGHLKCYWSSRMFYIETECENKMLVMAVVNELVEVHDDSSRCKCWNTDIYRCIAGTDCEYTLEWYTNVLYVSDIYSMKIDLKTVTFEFILWHVVITFVFF